MQNNERRSVCWRFRILVVSLCRAMYNKRMLKLEAQLYWPIDMACLRAAAAIEFYALFDGLPTMRDSTRILNNLLQVAVA